jgi:hypothetical protein
MQTPTKDFWDSIVRTYVPLGVGALAAWLMTLGLPVPDDVQAHAVIALTAASQGLYYLVVRLWEQRRPQAGILLGRAKAPSYETE